MVSALRLQKSLYFISPRRTIGLQSVPLLNFFFGNAEAFSKWSFLFWEHFGMNMFFARVTCDVAVANNLA